MEKEDKGYNVERKPNKRRKSRGKKITAQILNDGKDDVEKNTKAKEKKRKQIKVRELNEGETEREDKRRGNCRMAEEEGRWNG